MSEVGVEIVKTEEAEESGIRYLNINVSNSEIERKPDIVRLCADAGILEYAKPKIGHWIVWDTSSYDWTYKCDKCGSIVLKQSNYCPNCGAKMEEAEE